ncbi:MAG: ATP-dependent carboxylate-amine ligase [Methylomonas sp.]|nr:MAG: ATP-dependent carboxylate-amine ligase [Methylomonas sp.]PPD24266.1 MAG: ATP-dependent carboxylate-amine ligase [Methylomonas sp.]PPD32871.1 MAG: ATP-dependent carboxylate-amine ligase [Methylomonas sp.]PPD37993.1 MAG: ATP-dependent carboxylate-amine ligase [Methylomonas sp.]PPD55842.1 MAG: ATP-dependent carboxylate-amine ligase [Methylomonas sp.]
MKLLVFEYICGGGLAGQDLPSTLAAEGRLMLQAVLDDLSRLAEIDVTVLVDARLALPVSARMACVTVTATDDYRHILSQQLAHCDVFLPIAPESDGVLHQLGKLPSTLGKPALLSPTATIALCGDKLATLQQLARHGVVVAETRNLTPEMPWPQVVIKPIDGAGCQGSGLITDPDAYRSHCQTLEPAQWIVQPWLSGQAMSLSCLFQQGQGWLLSVNRQHVVIEQGRFRLDGCDVNCVPRHDYNHLVARIAQAMPGLWGYVGIDLIESDIENSPANYPVLEINPRLTTSYVGIYQATGINVIEQMLLMRDGVSPKLAKAGGSPVRVTVEGRAPW